ncbi:unnamed protein product [Allacma fusca]|uniref:Glypican-6 n=1 Tax=Allacma fusca TaxID=39272 RepID=A0A8J2JUH6_9HEXA|nr:unnamed protein product [Allacma fusca]
MITSILLLSSVIPFLILLPHETVCARKVDRECDAISKQMRSKGFSYPWWNTTVSPEIVPESEENTANGCPAVGSGVPRSVKCCRSFDAILLRNETGEAFGGKWLGPKLAGQAKVFNDSKARFDLTFKALLTRAHASFHAMFEKTYGMLYIQHAHVFHELFATFDAYYEAGKGSLDDKLNNFFAILTRKMFEVLNSQYEFSDAYLSCAAIVINDKQGNDLHRQIVSSLRRSFVATRALAQGLHDGNAVLTSLQKLEVSPDCLLSLSQMLHCPICLEARAYKPCIQVCTKVSSGCLSGTFVMTRPWTEFITAIEGIIDRLLGPYNVEAVVEPIHIKISEAIMNFQESGPDFSQAVFSKCGKPNLKSRNLRRREASAFDPAAIVGQQQQTSPKTAELRNSRPGQRGRVKETPHVEEDDGSIQPSKSLEKLLREIKKKIQKTKMVWDKLPQQVCNGISKDYSSQMCWNGSSLIKPDRNKSEEESEVNRSPASQGRASGPPNKLVADQILVLQFITDKLRASYNGHDVQWVEEIDDLELGSGQGSGSGDIPSDLDDSDDDDPSGEINPHRKKHPSRPVVPKGPPPSIFGRLPGEDDNDRDNSVSLEENNIPGLGNNNPGGIPIDFSNKPRLKPPTNSNPTVVIKPTFTTTTTRRPPPGYSGDVTKKIPTSSGNMDVATKTVAVFKLFTPIFVSMLGKLVSLS